MRDQISAVVSVVIIIVILSNLETIETEYTCILVAGFMQKVIQGDQ